MLLPFLIQSIQSRAAALTDELMQTVRSSPRTSYLKQIGEEEFRRRALDLFANLGRWLEAGRAAEIETVYTDLGQRRCKQGVLVSELVSALVHVKHRLWQHVQSLTAGSGSSDSGNRIELLAMIDRFFDQAIYHVLRGYEIAQAETRGVG